MRKSEANGKFISLPVNELSDTIEEDELNKVTFQQYTDDEYQEETADNELDVDEYDQDDSIDNDYEMFKMCIDDMKTENDPKLVTMLHSFVSNCKNTDYLKYTACLENDLLSIYYSPIMQEKMILLNTIISCLSDFNYSNDELIKITKNIAEVCSDINLVIIENSKYSLKNILTRDENLLKNNQIKDIIDKLTFLDEEMINKSIDYLGKKNKLSDDEYALFELQVFTYASIFMDMNKLITKVYDYSHKVASL